MLHTNADLAVAVEGPVEAHYVGGVAFVQHLQLSDNLVPNGGLDFKVDQLDRWRGGAIKKCELHHSHLRTSCT